MGIGCVISDLKLSFNLLVFYGFPLKLLIQFIDGTMYTNEYNQFIIFFKALA